MRISFYETSKPRKKKDVAGELLQYKLVNFLKIALHYSLDISASFNFKELCIAKLLHMILDLEKLGCFKSTPHRLSKHFFSYGAAQQRMRSLNSLLPLLYSFRNSNSA